MRYEMNIALLSEEGREHYKRVICEELWLTYYNDTLRRHGIITEKEHMKMYGAILVRTGRLLKRLR